jgi:hypothetical protein
MIVIKYQLDFNFEKQNELQKAVLFQSTEKGSAALPIRLNRISLRAPKARGPHGLKIDIVGTLWDV